MESNPFDAFKVDDAALPVGYQWDLYEWDDSTHDLVEFLKGINFEDESPKTDDKHTPPRKRKAMTPMQKAKRICATLKDPTIEELEDLEDVLDDLRARIVFRKKGGLSSAINKLQCVDSDVKKLVEFVLST